MGRGGTEPTITDADVVLGRINPDYFLGGEAKLDGALARDAIEQRIGGPLGLSTVDAARAIIDIADAKMTGVLNFISVEQGIDPRDYILVPSGGAGPTHAVSIARSLGVKTVLVPPTPGLNSALGLLASDLKLESVRTIMQTTEGAEIDDLNAILDEMESTIRHILREERVAEPDISIVREFDMCYVGQSFRLRIPWEMQVDASFPRTIADRFHRHHAEAYGFSNPGAPTSVINVRLIGTGRVDRPMMRTLERATGSVERARKSRRPVHFGEQSEAVDTDIFDRSLLMAGDELLGPAIIEQMDTTIVVPQDASVHVDDNGNLAILLDI